MDNNTLNSTKLTNTTYPRASMGRRLAAYLIDFIFFGIVGTLLVWLIAFTYYYSASLALVLSFLSILIVFLLPTLLIYYWDGKTVGKYLLKIKVVRLDGGKITFWDAFLREGIIKQIANALVITGAVNLISFIWACITPDNKTLHDLAAKTTVIDTRQP